MKNVHKVSNGSFQLATASAIGAIETELRRLGTKAQDGLSDNERYEVMLTLESFISQLQRDAGWRK